MKEFHWGKYILVFLITASIFGTALVASNFFYERRLQEIDTLERRMTLNLLSSEVQFELLAVEPCSASTSPVLADEINTLASRLEFLEGERGSGNEEVKLLKARYSLLQIKDLLLVKEIAKRCGGTAHTIVYFYSNQPGHCAECERQGYVLSSLRNKYGDLKVYAFDYDLELGGITALKKIYSVENDLPALVVNRTPHYGFQNLEAIERLLPELATTTPAK